MDKISVILITKNEEANIQDCLKSVDWADEIILVDAESTDNTIMIAKLFNPKIFVRKWDGYAAQKAFALSKASNEWVLSIDADERVSPSLKDEILSLKDNDADGYYIRRQNYFLRRHIKSCGWDNDFQLRLFKKSATKLTDRLVHEGFVVNGVTKRLNNRLIHFTFTSIEKTINKINHYSSLKAEELFKKNKRSNGFTIIAHGLAAFFRFFIVLGGYKEGVHGMIISLFNSFTTFLVYMKLWELRIEQKIIENNSK